MPKAEYASFLPTLDLSCVRTSGQEFLRAGTNESNTLLPVSGFFDAISNGCSSETLSFSGGYDTGIETLSMNVAINLTLDRTPREIAKGIESILGTDLSLDSDFWEALSKIDMTLSGSFLLDFSVGVRGLSVDLLNQADYGSDFSAFLEINDFQVVASVTADPINLDFPVSIPSPGVLPPTLLNLTLVDGAFDVRFSVITSGPDPIALTDIFGDTSTVNLTYDGSFLLELPVELTISDQPFGLFVKVNDTDLLTGPSLEFSYELDICSIQSATEDLFTELTEEIVNLLESELDFSDLPFDTKDITKPIIDRANSSLIDLTNNILDGLDIDCNSRRHLQEADSTSFLNKIQAALDSVQQSLEEVGLTVGFAATPEFESETFRASVGITFNVTLAMTGSDVKEIFEEFVGKSVLPTNLDTLGLEGTEDSESVTIDFDKLLNDTSRSIRECHICLLIAFYLHFSCFLFACSYFCRFRCYPPSRSRSSVHFGCWI